MSRRTRTVAAALVLGLWIAGTVALRGDSADTAERARHASTKIHRLSWKPGSSYRYDVRLSSDNATRPIQDAPNGRTLHEPISVTFDLEAELDVRVHRQEQDGYVVGLALERCRKARLEASGELLLEGARACDAAIRDQELLVHIAENGRIAGIYEGPRRARQDSLFPYLARAVATAMSMSLGTNERWIATEETFHGQAQGTYEVRSREAGITLQRARTSYQSLRVLAQNDPTAITSDVKADHVIRLHPEGHLLGLEGSERVLIEAPEGRVVDAHDVVHLRFLSTAPLRAPAPRLEGLALRGLTEAPDDGSAQHKRMQRRADGLSVPEAKQMLVAYGPSGILPEHNRSLVRLHALLHLQPELAGELGLLAIRPEATPQLRALVLDLLAQTGTHEAQAALREIFEATEGDPHRHSYLQRAALVREPDSETIALLEREVEAGDEEGTAALYTLGTLSKRVEPAERERLIERIEENLEDAPDPESRAHALVALANAEHGASRHHFEQALVADEPSVRRAGLVGLEHLADDDARRRIAQAVSDPSSSVQSTALHALSEVGAGDAELNQVAHEVRERGLPHENVGAVVSLLSRSRATSPETTRELAQLVLEGAKVSDPALKAALARLARS